jgi:hypothetical protein
MFFFFHPDASSCSHACIIEQKKGQTCAETEMPAPFLKKRKEMPARRSSEKTKVT